MFLSDTRLNLIDSYYLLDEGLVLVCSNRKQTRKEREARRGMVVCASLVFTARNQ